MKFSVKVTVSGFMAPEVIADYRQQALFECNWRAAKAGHYVVDITESNENIDKGKEIITFTAECLLSPFTVVVCDTRHLEKAQEYGYKTVWPEHPTMPLLIDSQRALGILYGKSLIPYTVFPGTKEVPWHSWISYHVRCGRLIYVPPIEKQKELDIADNVPAEALADTE